MAHRDNKKQTKPELTSLLRLNPLQTVLPPNAPAATPLRCTAVLDHLQLLKSHGYAFSTYIEKILKGQPILWLLLCLSEHLSPSKRSKSSSHTARHPDTTELLHRAPLKSCVGQIHQE